LNCESLFFSKALEKDVFLYLPGDPEFFSSVSLYHLESTHPQIPKSLQYFVEIPGPGGKAGDLGI